MAKLYNVMACEGLQLPLSRQRAPKTATEVLGFVKTEGEVHAPHKWEAP